MGVAELSAILSVVSMLLLGLATFVGRGVHDKVEKHETRLAELSQAVAVMGATKLGERVQKLEEDMSEIKGDLRVIRSWVEGQGHFHRRAGDKQEA